MVYSPVINPPNLDGWLKDNFTCPPFTLSYDWQELIRQEGWPTERLAITDGQTIIAATLAIYFPLPLRQKYVFCPLGPVILPAVHPQAIYTALHAYFQNQHCLFFRIENQTTDPATTIKNIKKTRDINPRATIRLNLTQSPDQILSDMYGKTRYNIRLAEKHGLTVKQEKNLPIFLALLKKTGARDEFRLHPDKHYGKILSSSLSQQITVYQNNIPLAAGIFIGFGDTYTYLFGASNYEYRQLMAPYLMQWTAIKTAQSFGYRVYDFFGIAPPDAGAGHQYAGVTRFKTGFGGEVVQATGTYDVIIHPLKYCIYNLFRKINRLRSRTPR